MARNVNDIKGLSPARRKKVEARAAQLTAEEINRADFKAFKRTMQRKGGAAPRPGDERE
jgi:hypothetical protein